MFERFTTQARVVVQGAVTAAEGLGHRYVGTEHLLLSILDSGGGVANSVLREAGLEAERVRNDIQRLMGDDAEALETIGIDLDAVKAKIEESFGPGALDNLETRPRRRWFRRPDERRPHESRRPQERRHRPFTPRAKKVLELSLREALALKHNYIGTEHLLLGLLREGKGLAAKIMADAGLDFVQLREQTLSAIPGK